MGYTESFSLVEGYAAAPATDNSRVVSFVNGLDTRSSILMLQIEAALGGDNTSPIDDAMVATIQDWMRVTHHVMDYQYVFDMNSYVKSVQDDEKERLGKKLDTVTNEVMVKKQMYMMRQRDSDKLRSRIRLLLHAMLFVSFFAFMYANRTHFGAVGWAVTSAGSLAFAIYLIMYLKISGSRRYDDWEILYFNEDGKIKATANPDVDPAASAGCRSAT